MTPTPGGLARDEDDARCGGSIELLFGSFSYYSWGVLQSANESKPTPNHETPSCSCSDLSFPPFVSLHRIDVCGSGGAGGFERAEIRRPKSVQAGVACGSF